MPNRLCRTAKPRRFTMTSGRTGNFGEDLERVGNDLIGLDLGGARKRVVSIAFSLLHFTLRDRNMSAGRQCLRPVPTHHRRDRIIG